MAQGFAAQKAILVFRGAHLNDIAIRHLSAGAHNRKLLDLCSISCRVPAPRQRTTWGQ